jgi:hypothetical protein
MQRELSDDEWCRSFEYRPGGNMPSAATGLIGSEPEQPKHDKGPRADFDQFFRASVAGVGRITAPMLIASPELACVKRRHLAASCEFSEATVGAVLSAQKLPDDACTAALFIK